MLRFRVPDMTCGGCARAVTNAIRAVDPAAEVVADPPGRMLSVGSTAGEATLVAALEEAGYHPERRPAG